jgi:hypothetical protein
MAEWLVLSSYEAVLALLQMEDWSFSAVITSIQIAS